ncbi:hypothetical protein WA026_014983 [Henosepilachna vigintioctopunctata]|uniref:UNC93-like protein MFSD11 n=1 Tax=Henosepilachna vigintioctopunctata TaxID=420089 RepID=A0AAW1U2L5_9CUCU
MVDAKCRHVLIMSLASMFLMGIFQILIFIVVSVEDLKAQNMFSGIGFRCLIIIYSTIIITALLMPFLIHSTSPKITMFMGCATYMLFLLCLIHPVLEIVYFGAMMFGTGSVMLGTAQGTYLVKNSTKSTISKHCAIYWTIIQISTFFGGIIVYIRFLDVKNIDQGIRVFMIGILLGFSFASLIFVSLLPNYTEGYYLYKSKQKKRDYIRLFLEITRLLRSQIIMVLCIPFFFLGFYIVFITVNFSLAVGHSTQLERPKELSHFVGIFIGLGEISGGFLLLITAVYLSGSYRIVKITVGFVSLVTAHFMVFVNLPNEASDRDTDDTSVVEPSAGLVVITSFLLGIADSCFNTQIIESLALFYPRITALVFPIFEMFQAVGVIAANFVSTLTALYGVLASLVGLSLVTFICYIISESLVSDEDVILDKFAGVKKSRRKSRSSDSSGDRSSRSTSRPTTSSSDTLRSTDSWSEITPTTSDTITSRSSHSTSEERRNYVRTKMQEPKPSLLSSARMRIINCFRKILGYAKGSEDQEETLSSKSVSSTKVNSISQEEVLRTISEESFSRTPSRVSIYLPNSEPVALKASKSSTKLSQPKGRKIDDGQNQPSFLQKLMSIPIKIPWIIPEGEKEAKKHPANLPKPVRPVHSKVTIKTIPNAVSVRNDSSTNLSVKSNDQYGRENRKSIPNKGILRTNVSSSSDWMEVSNTKKKSSKK